MIITKNTGAVSANTKTMLLPITLSQAQVEAILDMLAAANPTATLICYDSDSNVFYRAMTITSGGVPPS